MTAFRFIFPDDDEGFELVDTETTTELDNDEDENEDSQTSDDKVIWETEED